MKRTISASIVLAALSSATALASADAAPRQQASTQAIHHGNQRAGHSYQVVAKVDKTEPMLHDKVRIKATVTPAAPGASVTLQLKYDDQKKWKTIDHGRLDGRGKVTFKDKVSSLRVRKYRVVKPADAKAGAGRGDTAKVTVYGWRTLTSLQPVISQGLFEWGNVAINGTSYPDSILRSGASPAGQIDYNLNHDCKQLDAVYGLADSSPSGSSTTLALTADGAPKHSGTYALTQAQRVVTDITGVFRISFTSASLGGGLAAVGTPKVLCSF